MKCIDCGIEFECDVKFKDCRTKECFCRKCWKKTRSYIENPHTFDECYNVHIEPEKVKFD